MPIEYINDLAVLSLSGQPDEMGYEHGTLLKCQIQEASERFLEKSEQYFGVNYKALCQVSQEFLPYISPDHLVEIRAIASGANVPFETILCTNILVDMEACIRNSANHCCNFIVSSPSTRESDLIHGRNLDFAASSIIPKYSVIVFRRPTGKIPTCGITWVGFAGFLTGISAESVSAGEVGAATTDYGISGAPIALMLRSALEECQTLDDIELRIASTDRVAGFNLAFACGKTIDGMALETTRSLCARRGLNNGAMVVDDVCLCRQTSKNRLVYPWAAYRYARAMMLIRQHEGQIDEKIVFDILSDHFDIARGRQTLLSPACICNRETVQSVVFRPGKDIISVAAAKSAAPLRGYKDLILSEYW